MKLPNKCGDCWHVKHYRSGFFAKLPHSCCELFWNQFEEDVRVDPETLYPDCLLRNPKYVESKRLLNEIYDEIFSDY